MNDPNHVKSIFLDASERPLAERAAFLDEATGGDVVLRARVEALLRAHDNPDGFLEEAAAEFGATVDLSTPQPPLAEHAGTLIGPYKLLEQIGEGGMGVVYMADQQAPVCRRVALKIIKAGMDTRQVIARFEAERQALALMDHSNIARVLDAGATDSGRPYFVMELVRGIPITEYCDRSNLSISKRLELFSQVCQAVQHAHQKGIIHRDIKPSNVLVSTQDDRPVAKVIDFGVAKAIQARLTEKTLFTGFQQLVGTPAYMSPEQAGGSLDIDTRTDVYSLGVLLYELLAGSPPFDPKELRSKAFAEMQRIIREVEPPTPSSRLSTLETLPTIAAHRAVDPRRLAAIVRGELDWIVMKCLEKERARRYATASAIVLDVQRYLNDEPVEASPPSATYKLRKLARKYRGPLVAATGVAILLVAATIFSSWQAVRARQATAAALVEKERADQEAMSAKRITESFQEMLGLTDPDAASWSMTSLSAVRLQVMLGLVRADKMRGLDYTVLQLIDDFAENLEGKLADRPAAAANLHAMIGGNYAVPGYREKARKHLARALELAGSVYGEDDDKYADILVVCSRPDCSDPNQRAEREADLRRALAIYRAREIGGERVIRAICVLLWNLGEQGHGGAPDKFDLMEPLINDGLAETRKFPGVEFDKTPILYDNLAGIRLRQSKYVEAEKIARRTLPMHLKLHPHSLLTGWGYITLGGALRPQGKFTEALAAEKKALAMMRNVLPPEHPSIAVTSTAVINTLTAADEANSLAKLFPTLSELGELESVFREVLKTTKPTRLRWDDPALIAAQGLVQDAQTYVGLSEEWAAAGKTTEAEDAARKTRPLLESLQDDLAGMSQGDADKAELLKLQTQVAELINQQPAATRP